MEEKGQRPLIVEIDEAKQEIIDSINNALQVHKVSCYFLDMILSDICTQIKEVAKSELEMAKKQVKDEGEA